MKRNTCPVCQFPTKTCVCSYIGNVIPNATQVIIMQHPSEVKVAKNTAKLLALQLDSFALYVGENTTDFEELINFCNGNHVALLYPNSHAKTLTTEHNRAQNLDAIILLDGTWKKATKLYKLNPWLSQLPSFQFDSVNASEYTIRKSKHEYSLSTLEAAAQFLEIVDQCETADLYKLQAGMVKEQMTRMPDDVKARY
ncbi:MULTISPECIES: tRNA-uridine aminocarboxypropyltransferase [Pseudoalteromonas]|uniref:tRNA-uridine aminocarboxypropyltransferase n=1 Tax=Pseudoalteromonas TaxID=53246 RepID=UPI001572BB68|nr:MULTISPECIES: tRNA-uridine aminocarboxypropyltransferase [Pseudoalteromonas]MBR8844628.1 DTW domain-containing protein [Pseudoalteromonas sp. JC3]NSY32892.1 DTW domain-containing protein [Pseudoalteromonas sp. JC28]QUI70748.1 DTW domain-containing protein [Pseudoalteromonas sp. M8]UDM61877.1 DTW domain-containing protein [Pseudoalteromonas piscicida]WJE10457.1 tRNA-uridine aminocarboxypropyltransferase [Pseudoalteromonas sp. JC3]